MIPPTFNFFIFCWFPLRYLCSMLENWINIYSLCYNAVALQKNHCLYCFMIVLIKRQKEGASGMVGCTQNSNSIFFLEITEIKLSRTFYLKFWLSYEWFSFFVVHNVILCIFVPPLARVRFRVYGRVKPYFFMMNH